MVQTKATKQIPTAGQQLFMATLINLSWQLLLAVLIPFIGGHFLDKHFKTTPLWTLIGLGVALVLAGLSTYSAYKTVNKEAHA